MARGQARPWGRGERGGTLVLASSGGIAAGCGGGGGGGREAGSCVPCWLGKESSTCECARGRLRLESGRARTVALAASVVVEIGEGSFCRKLP